MQPWILRLQQKYYQWKANTKKTLIAPTLTSAWKNTQLPVNQDWQSLEFLIVDTETTALNINEGELLSIGWVTMINGDVQLCDAKHIYIKDLIEKEDSVGQSATIHQIRDCELQTGIYIEEAMDLFLEACRGRILVFHHAGLDLAFLNKHIRYLMGAPLLIPYVDTLAMEKKKLGQQQDIIHKNDLTLSQCRTRYHLPDYPAHNALNDALATAELLQAQLSHKGNCVQGKDILFS